MRTFLFALGLLAFAFAVHWSVWRVRIPKRQTLALLVIFFSVLFLGLLASQVTQGLPWTPSGLVEVLHVALFHTAVTLSYIVLYSAIEEDSPTLKLVRFVEQAGDEGRHPDELYGVITDELIVGSRLDAMTRDGMITKDGEMCRLTPKGRGTAQLFRTTATLMGLRKGG